MNQQGAENQFKDEPVIDVVVDLSALFRAIDDGGAVVDAAPQISGPSPCRRSGSWETLADLERQA